MTKWREYLTTLILAVVCAVVVRNYFVTAYKVPTGSMQPTLKPGDFIFSYRGAYGFKLPFVDKKILESLPERGDVVVFTYAEVPDVTYVKRVIALPGDKLQIQGGRIVLNDVLLSYEKMESEEGNPLPELFEIQKETLEERSWRVIFQKMEREANFGPIVIPPGEIFLLGDNRDASDDSRYWGSVPLNAVSGRVFLIWFSLNSQERWLGNSYPSIRWHRVFSTVH